MIVNKLIPIDRPYQFTNRHDILDPATGMVIGAGISGVSSILGGLFNRGSQSSANRTNLRINRENQKWNEKMMDKQNAWNLAQWNRENVYNSASQQVARLRAAGLNPYLMMNGGNAGSAQSITSAAPASAGMSNTVNPVDYSAAAAGVGNAVGGAISQYYNGQLAEANVRKIIAEAAGQEKQNTYLDARLQAEIDNLIENTKDVEARKEYEKFRLIHARSMWAGDLAHQSLENSALAENIVNQRANTYYTQMQSTLAELNISWLPKMKEAELAQYCAQTFAAIEAGKLSQKQGIAAIQGALESQARTQGIKINNNTLKAQAKYIVVKASWDANKSKWDAKHSKANSGPDSYFQMMNGNNGYSGPGVGLFNVMDYMLKAIPFSNLK